MSILTPTSKLYQLWGPNCVHMRKHLFLSNLQLPQRLPTPTPSQQKAGVHIFKNPEPIVACWEDWYLPKIYGSTLKLSSRYH